DIKPSLSYFPAFLINLFFFPQSAIGNPQSQFYFSLKLAHCPRSLAPSLVALPSISLIPFARFLFLNSYFRSTLRCEAFAHWYHPGRTGGFSGKTRRGFLSREAGYCLQLHKTRRRVRRHDRVA